MVGFLPENLKTQPPWLLLAGLVNFVLLVAVLTTAALIEQSLVGLPLVGLVFGISCMALGGWAGLFLTSFLAALFYLFSFAKYATSGFGLVASDSSMIGGNIIDLIRLDWRVQLFALGLCLLILLQGFVLARMARPRKRSLGLGGAALACALAALPAVKSASQAAVESAKPPDWAVGIVPSFATFTGSLAMPGLTMPTAERLPWAEELLSASGGAAATGNRAQQVSLFLILYESTFDAAYLEETGLPVRESEILRPRSGVAGPLLVPAYSGGTWLTEFALLTGQSPHAFGANAYALNSLLEGRIASSLLDPLTSAGAGFKVIYPFPAYFLNAGAFYRGLGAEFIEPSQEELNAFRRDFSDAFLFSKAEESLEPDAPNLQMIVTMKNHGPHDLDAPYEDYWQRHQVQVAALASFKSTLASRFPGRPNYVLAFGDHQPFFTHGRLGSTRLRHTTFWSLDCVGACPAIDEARFRKEPLGIEFLLTMVLEGLDLPLSPTSLVHRRLFEEGCSSFLFDCSPAVAQSFNWYFGQAVIREEPKS